MYEVCTYVCNLSVYMRCVCEVILNLAGAAKVCLYVCVYLCVCMSQACCMFICVYVFMCVCAFVCVCAAMYNV